MTPEKARDPKRPEALKILFGDGESPFDKKLGRLKLVEESIDEAEEWLREHGVDIEYGGFDGVFYAGEYFVTIIENVRSALSGQQSVIAEIEKEMKT